ncbi:MAG: carbohydrate binding domain-containing protein [Kiritimatiellae bacterium]|nr:carbohydrate binding domain-containing protein [Kiritimatiellia bacterium]MDD4737283.1 carbohydrate binding domain-containing protein [Kiritimatiellia bacterium]
MTRFKLLLIGSVLSLVIQAGAQTLQNPSFEQEGVGADQAESWERWGDWINRETEWTPVRDGSCMIGYHHWKIENSNSSGLYQDIENVTPGKEYTFKVYAMRDDPYNADECPPSSIELRLESTVDGQQVTVGSKVYKFNDISTTLSGTWTPLRVSAKPRNSTLRPVIIVEPCIEGKRGGTLKLDDAALISE